MNAIVQHSPRSDLRRLANRLLICTGLFAVMLFVGVQVAHAAQIIPSVGVTQAVHPGDNNSRISGGFAVHGNTLGLSIR